MPDIDLLAEAQRQFAICNACRYCEGYCAVFPAMERTTTHGTADLNYLAHLCHDCRGCYQACMYTAPHPFAVDIPQLLATARERSFERYTAPAAARGAFRRPALAFGSVALVALAALATGAVVRDGGAFGRIDTAPGSFYRVVPYAVMVVGAFALAAAAVAAWARALARYLAELRAAGRTPDGRRLAATLWDGFALTYLRGGGAGCYVPDEAHPSPWRRRWHLTLVCGVLAAFVATTLAAIEQEFFHVLPPYAWFSPPVIAGTIGGVAMIAGATGLLLQKRSERRIRALDITFLVVLELLGASGLLLLGLRGTPAMAALLVAHLAFVAAAFVTAPYGKLIHGGYRLAALAVYHAEEGATT